VDVTITTMRSGVVRVEDAEESLYASVDLVADKIARKLKKVGGRVCAILQCDHAPCCSLAQGFWSVISELAVAPSVVMAVRIRSECCAAARRGCSDISRHKGGGGEQYDLQQLIAAEACKFFAQGTSNKCCMQYCFPYLTVHWVVSLHRCIWESIIQVKDKLIAQGAWPGSGGPRVNTEEEDFKVHQAAAGETA